MSNRIWIAAATASCHAERGFRVPARIGTKISTFESCEKLPRTIAEGSWDAAQRHQKNKRKRAGSSGSGRKNQPIGRISRRNHPSTTEPAGNPPCLTSDTQSTSQRAKPMESGDGCLRVTINLLREWESLHQRTYPEVYHLTHLVDIVERKKEWLESGRLREAEAEQRDEILGNLKSEGSSGKVITQHAGTDLLYYSTVPLPLLSRREVAVLATPRAKTYVEAAVQAVVPEGSENIY
ncbi:hypothetical protein EV426DRAFT_712209 [Tirmania nivea]|nr:hypothetical protein EV426DRAFT_712209 [Tirmania nivea]